MMPLNLPNVLTLLRILAVPVVVVALLSEVEDGDVIDIDIPARSIELRVSDDVLAARRTALEAAGGYVPVGRERAVSPALRAYAAMATSADKGAVRDVEKLHRH